MESIFEQMAALTKPEEEVNCLYGYPELTEDGKKATQRIIDRFKDQLEKLVNDTLYSFTCNLADEITNDDSWIDIRQKTRDALCGYPTLGQYSSTNWVQIRKRILEENREQIVNDIITDKDKEIANLKEQIARMQNDRMFR